MAANLLTLLALAGVSAATTWSENLVLADCGIGLGPGGGSTSREMMYYSGAAWGAPTYMANVPWDGSYPWRRSSVTQTLPNGDKWTVWVNPDVRDPGHAGLAWHTYDAQILFCYSKHVDGLFTLADGTKCSMAYVCNHTPPAGPAPKPTTKFTFNIREDTVEMVGHRSPADIFNLVQWSGTDNRYCADKRITIPNSAKFDDPKLPDCTVKFTCGPNNGKMMQSAARQISDKVWVRETKDLPNCKKSVSCMTPQACYTICHQTAECSCGNQSNRRDITTVPSRMVVDKEGDGQSRFEYEIVCPSQKTRNCNVCYAARVLALPLDLITFGLASVTVAGTCTFDGC